MKKKNQGRKSQFDGAFRVALAQEYLTSNLSYKELAIKYGIDDPENVRYTVNWYKKTYGTEGFISSQATQPVETSLPDQQALQLLKEKEQQLKAAQLKVQALELLIANAQKELGVDLIKKLGTKQSDK